MSSPSIETVEGAQDERSSRDEQPIPSERRPIGRARWGLLLINIACISIGGVGGPLLQRLYFVHGGSRKWLSSCLQSVGFPFVLLPLALLHSRSHLKGQSPLLVIKPKLAMAGAFLGLFMGFNCYMYSVGLAYIPVSTSSLLFSTSLAFTAVFAFLLVRQKFTVYSFNSVVLMTLGAIALALHTSTDRPSGSSNNQYFLGFFFMLGGAALLGAILPSIELSYMKAGQAVSYAVVMQFQVVFTMSATIVCIVGMAINNDFEVIPREAREYGLGKTNYYVVLVASALVWQLSMVGTVGLVYCSSSLFVGVVNAVLLPFTQVAAVITFHEKFTAEKGMSLALCLWGFTSYFVGEYKMSKKMKAVTMKESEPVDNEDGA
ncbi:hypothetical protein ACLOJK_016407 [Asimina triloba]